jgi:hypothetical protein
MGDVSPDFKGCSLAFHLYARLVSDDHWAEKGVGYVRLQNTRTNRPLNVFFTHNQAMYWDTSPKPFHQHSVDVERGHDRDRRSQRPRRHEVLPVAVNDPLQAGS